MAETKNETSNKQTVEAILAELLESQEVKTVNPDIAFFNDLREKFNLSTESTYDQRVKTRSEIISSFTNDLMKERAKKLPQNEEVKAGYAREELGRKLQEKYEASLGTKQRLERMALVAKFKMKGVNNVLSTLRIYERNLLLEGNPDKYQISADQKKLTPKQFEDLHNDFKNMHSFLEADVPIAFLSKCDNFPLGYERLFDVLGGTIAGFSAAEPDAPGLLNILSAIPEQQYKASLAQLRKFPFLYPPRVTDKTFAETVSPLVILLRSELSNDRLFLLNALKKIGLLVGDEKLSDHPIASGGLVNILKNQDNILDELESLQLIIYSLKDYPNLLDEIPSKAKNIFKRFDQARKSKSYMPANLAFLGATGWSLNAEDAHFLFSSDDSALTFNSINNDISRSSRIEKWHLKTPLKKEYWLFFDEVFSNTAGKSQEDIVYIDSAPFLVDVFSENTMNLFFNAVELVMATISDPEERKNCLRRFCKMEYGLGLSINTQEMSKILSQIEKTDSTDQNKKFQEVWKSCEEKNIHKFNFFPEFMMSNKDRIFELFDEDNVPTNMFFNLFTAYLNGLRMDMMNINLIGNLNKLDITSENQLESIISLVPDDVDQEFINKIHLYIDIRGIFKSEAIKDWKNYRNQIFTQMLQVEDTEYVLGQIKEILGNTDLPDVGIIFKMFELLYLRSGKDGETLMQSTLSEHDAADVSPSLVRAKDRMKKYLVYNDLLKIHVDSNNNSLRSHLQLLGEAESLFEKVDLYDITSLTNDEKLQLFRMFKRLDIIFNQTSLDKSKSGHMDSSSDIDILIQNKITSLENQFQVRSGQTLIDRIIEMYARPLGFDTLQAVLDKMSQSTVRADAQNREMIESSPEAVFKLTPDTLFAPINVSLVTQALNNGITAPEYMSEVEVNNGLPFSVKLGAIKPDKMEASQLADLNDEYQLDQNNVLLVFSNEGQFKLPSEGRLTAQDYELSPLEEDSTKYNHFGVRSGISSSEISAMVVGPSLAKNDKKIFELFFQISLNGMYIPVFDVQTGKCLLTPKLFDAMKVKPELILKSIKGDESPHAIIESFKQSLYLKKLYEGPAYVTEGVSLQQHTEGVMRQFLRYFSEFTDFGILSKQEFLTLFALHDIGKPLAKEIAGTSTEQHFFTKKVILPILMQLGMTQLEIDKIASIASQDYLGIYMQGKADADKTARAIVDLAFSLGVFAPDLLKTLKIYFMSDASSYTTDALKDIKKFGFLDHLFVIKRDDEAESGEIELAAKQKESYELLERTVIGLISA